MKTKKLVIANWKMNPKTLGAAERLVAALVPSVRRTAADVVFCPPTPFIAPLKMMFSRFSFGAQDAFYEDEGPYTGAVGPGELKSIGAQLVIAGHSERRNRFNETDSDVSKKIKAVLAVGLFPVLCVGEPLSIRRKGILAARSFVRKQVLACLKGIPKSAKIAIAYEPIWAISTSGSGKKENPEDAAEMIRFIKKIHPARVLYGGSVNSKNAEEFLAYREIDGLLVGGASLKPKEFSIILRHA